jgi:hypothetical protein
MQIFSRITFIFLLVVLLFMMTLQSIGTVGAREQTVHGAGVTNSPFLKSLEITSTPVATVYLPIVISQENPTGGTVIPTSQPTSTPEVTSTSTVEATATFTTTSTATATAQSSPTLTPTTVVTTTPTVSPTTVPALNVRITYIDPISEYVVIENPTSSNIVMTGWTLRDAVSTTFTFPDYTLQASSVVTVWVYTGTNDAQNLYWGRTGTVWNNDKDTANLADADGKDVHQYSYPTTTPNPDPDPDPDPVITSTIPVTIVQVQYTPTEEEHVEIKNTGTTPVVMTGWTLRDEGSYEFVFPDFTLQPGAAVKVWVFTGTNDAENLYSGLKSPVWNNDSDIATLRDDKNVKVAVYTYPTGSANPVPTVPTYEVGSSPATATVRITYIEYNPAVGNNVDGEFVRIKNFGGSAVDMIDWSLCDDKNSCYKFVTFTLQSQNVVEVWVKDGTDTVNTLYWGNNRATWNNEGDTALLKDKNGDLIHRCTYGDTGEASVDCEAILTGGR